MRRTSFSRHAALAALVLSVGAPGLAYAGDTSTAENLFEEGMAALKREDYKAACEAFFGSNEADASPGTEINLALCNEKQGKLATAWGWYRTAAGLADQRGQRERAERARSEASRLEPLLPKLRITTKDAASTLTILRDGTVVPTATIGKDVPVDPGSHAIEVSAKGKKTWKGSVDIASAARVTPFELPKLDDEPEEKATPVAGTVVGGDALAADKGSSSTQRNVGFILGGAGIVAGAVAIGLELLALREDDKRKEQDGQLAQMTAVPDGDPNKKAIIDSRDSHKSAANSNQLVAIVSGAGGIVLIGVGVTLILTSQGSSKTTGQANKPMVVPILGNGTAGLGFHTSF
ncbi:hypothetical protein [Labilithrix luteola]|nr:hypothetical protein [Labilithrix luteola]